MAIVIEVYNAFDKYINIYGWHFSKELCQYAISLMKKNNMPIESLSKEVIDQILLQYGVVLNNNIEYDYVFIANMCKADYYGSSILNEQQMALYIKDTIDDEDASNETTFRRWLATMEGNHQIINWEQFI